MHRYRLKKKIYNNLNNIIFFNFNINKLKKKKWFFLKKKLNNNSNNSNNSNKSISLKKLYKERLNSKQQLKFFYNIPEYQFKYLLKKKNKNNFEKFLINLESRIDIILYRLNISKSVNESKQFINHGKIYINNNKIYTNNILLNKGDLIYIEKKIKIINKNIPKYLEYNNNLNKFFFLRKPFFNEIKYPFILNKNLILNFYKK